MDDHEMKKRLIARGFSERTLINNRGLIGAVMEEMVTPRDSIQNSPWKYHC